MDAAQNLSLFFLIYDTQVNNTLHLLKNAQKNVSHDKTVPLLDAWVGGMADELLF